MNENSVVRNFRTTASDSKSYDVNDEKTILFFKMVQNKLLLAISQQMALEKSGAEYEIYKEDQKKLSNELSLKEIEEDIKKLKLE